MQITIIHEFEYFRMLFRKNLFKINLKNIFLDFIWFIVYFLFRFDYDWEREIAVKSNEYFEFPRELDMEPYTVRGVSRIEKQQEIMKEQQLKKQLQQEQEQLKQLQSQSTEKNEIDSKHLSDAKESSGDPINNGDKINSNTPSEPSETIENDDSFDENSVVYSNNYKLVGIVVHSGQANGGHYYSFIQNKSASTSAQTTNEDDDTKTDNSESISNQNNYENNWYVI